MDTLAEFSRETEDASVTAKLMVRNNISHGKTDIAWSSVTITESDGQSFDVAWTFRPSTSEVIVCWWSPARP
jgi:predicted transcriptional regulator